MGHMDEAARLFSAAAELVPVQYAAGIEQELMVRGIYATLDAVGAASMGPLRDDARKDAETFLEFVTGGR